MSISIRQALKLMLDALSNIICKFSVSYSYVKCIQSSIHETECSIGKLFKHTQCNSSLQVEDILCQNYL